MRRLPVYLVLDTSGSMNGEPIEAIKNGVQVLVTTLRQDPYALETAYLSVITFDSTAKQLVPLTELGSFQQPILQRGVCAADRVLAPQYSLSVASSLSRQERNLQPLFLRTLSLEPHHLSALRRDVLRSDRHAVPQFQDCIKPEYRDYDDQADSQSGIVFNF